jgi:DNA-directed RNA polymerase specialized sigma24 family protein
MNCGKDKMTKRKRYGSHISKLTEELKKEIVLHYKEGKSVSEIAEITNVYFGTILWYLLDIFPKPIRL